MEAWDCVAFHETGQMKNEADSNAVGTKHFFAAEIIHLSALLSTAR
jgi:hypothetical protein